jgi:hypothetical protein
MTADRRSRMLLEAGNRALGGQPPQPRQGLLVAVVQSVAAGSSPSTTRRIFLCNDAALAMLRQGREVTTSHPAGVGRS